MMDPSLLLPAAILLILLASGLWVFAALLLTALATLVLSAELDPSRAGIMLSRVMVGASRSWELSSVPLFLFMGEILLRGGLSQKIFDGLSPLLSRLPGGHLHVNIVGCTLFSAVSGSSTATTATVGKVSLPELKKRGYAEGLSVGSLAGAGSFGLLIPPSIALIIYGVLSETSIAKLFAAGLIPGFVIATAYSAYIAIVAPRSSTISAVNSEDLPLGHAVTGLLPILALVVLVLGSIYAGLASPTEAASIGVAGAVVLAALERQLSLRILKVALAEAMLLTSVLGAVVVAASLLASAIGMAGLPQEIAAGVASLDLGPGMLILLLAVIYLGLGLFLDGISILVLTLPIVLPIVMQSGIDLVWFGVFLTLMIELGLMTPPVGFNLFVIQSVSGVAVGRVARGAAPFFLLMLCCVVLFTLVPDIVLWLPERLY